MDDASFKITLIKALEHKLSSNPLLGTDNMWEVIMT